MKFLFQFKFIILVFCLFFYNATLESKSIRILFIGNSFTHMHNFSQMVTNIGIENRDTIYSDYSAIDSYTLEKHYSNPETIEKIKYGCWDYVVLQEQSQRPVMDSATFYNKTYYYAKELTDLIYTNNPTVQILLFLTWGRKYGDTELCEKYKWTCSYTTMQDMLVNRYNFLGSKLALPVAPCGIAWKYFDVNEPKHINLFDSDNKHSNESGSYLNACVFYVILTGKNPSGTKYNPAMLQEKELLEIQEVAYSTVKKYLPIPLKK